MAVVKCEIGVVMELEDLRNELTKIAEDYGFNITGKYRDVLEKLRADANEACIAAQKVVEDAVNWGDLSCIQSEIYFTNDGRTGYRVIISEASPDAGVFRTFIHNWLKEKGWQDVEVFTEW